MFRVRWARTALNNLTVLWTEASATLRAAITQAAHQIDQKLQSNAPEEGESRSGSDRILFVSPVGIIFRIEPDGQTVSVLRIWLFRGPKDQSTNGAPE